MAKGTGDGQGRRASLPAAACPVSPGALENWPPSAKKPSGTPRFPTVVLILSISPLLPLNELL